MFTRRVLLSDPSSDHIEANQQRCLNSRGRVGPHTRLFTIINRDCSCGADVGLLNIRLEMTRSDLRCLGHQVDGLSSFWVD